MKRIYQWKRGGLFAAVLAALTLFAGCGDPVKDTHYLSGEVASITIVPGVAQPHTEGIPAAAITETEQYTGTVVWKPEVGETFAPYTAYEATITLTAKTGYTFVGVEENFFKVAGATTTNAANSGVITAVFPPTGSGPDIISINEIQGVAKPIVARTPVAAITGTLQYTGTVEWSPAVTGTFAAGVVYTATITLTAVPGYTLDGVTANFFKVAGATATNSANSGVITAVFPASESGDTGVPDTSWYVPSAKTYTIYTADDLAGLAQIVNGGNYLSGKTITLGADIDLTVYGAGYNNGKGWIPIGKGLSLFEAAGGSPGGIESVFDGNHKTIANLYINDPDLDWAGLFGQTTANNYLVPNSGFRIKNLGLVNVNITAGNQVGGLAGQIKDGRITYSTPTQPLAGITNCYVTGTIKGNKFVGGLVGYNCSSIADSYVRGTVTGTEYVGGLVGNLWGGGRYLTSSFAAVEVEGNKFVGGLVGYLSGGSGSGNSLTTIENCAALNPSIKRLSGTETTFGRVTGAIYVNGNFRFSDNAAFAGMTINGAAVTSSDAASLNGVDITAAAIKTDGAIGGRFIAANGWTAENGKLPGLGAAISMPDWIQ